MEYVEGRITHDLLARERSLNPEQAFELMTRYVRESERHIIRNRSPRLKPLNIMICSDKPNLSQAVKILDFGLAKIKSGELLGSFIQAQTNRSDGIALLHGTGAVGRRRSRLAIRYL
jgi:serine/threonine protein kinase